MSITAASAAAGAPADQATVRRLNLALLLRSLAEGGSRSRARLAADTGLTKATVSTLVSDLQARQLVVEGDAERTGLGRPGRVLHLNTESVRCLGLEINVDYICGVAMDLSGQVRARARWALPMQSLGPARGLGVAADLARQLLLDCGAGAQQVRSVQLSMPGMVDVDSGILVNAPNLRWRDVDVVHSLLGRLDWRWASFTVDNDANLGAMAHYAAAPAGLRHLLYLSGEIGVGGGTVIDGSIVRGANGWAGEVGHMPLGPGDRVCGCGRSGCWETVVGLGAVLDAIADPGDALHDETIDMAERLDLVCARAAAGDERTLAGLRRQGHWLGMGLSILLNVQDPGLIVLGGYFPVIQEWIAEPMMAEIRRRAIALPDIEPRVEFSSLGIEASCLGAAHAGVEALIADPASAPIAAG
ncbi:ROK family protein [Nakamurella leprariae]|uniref:ROK family protein n=1 Tax=Nakamurella leprariae TaxID=2803911 RepID=A0A938Y4E8_9ACTN|nr:ROK family protein [Nakamurella leprariae]MBM9465871.1 ROK family protein [Nakamurella leprariae]